MLISFFLFSLFFFLFLIVNSHVDFYTREYIWSCIKYNLKPITLSDSKCNQILLKDSFHSPICSDMYHVHYECVELALFFVVGLHCFSTYLFLLLLLVCCRQLQAFCEVHRIIPYFCFSCWLAVNNYKLFVRSSCGLV